MLKFYPIFIITGNAGVTVEIQKLVEDSNLTCDEIDCVIEDKDFFFWPKNSIK